jgi:hypothetical protein
MKLFHFAVSSLFNLGTSSIVIAVLAVIVMGQINRAQNEVEISMMETDVANIRWGLREFWAHRTAIGQSIDANQIENTNPLQWVNERPENYRGEYADMPADAESVWYFDTSTKQLVYIFKDGHQARYRLASTAKLNRASRGAVGGMDLVLE